MNRIWQSVWNASTGTYVAAAENAKVRHAGSKTVKVAAAVVMALAASSGAMAQSDPTSYGALYVCASDGVADVVSAHGFSSADCPTGKVAFTLNGTNGTSDASDYVNAPARVTAFTDGRLELKGTTVTLYGPSTFSDTVTMQKALNMSGTRIQGLASGSAPTDAVNVSQLDAVRIHYFSVNNADTTQGNYDNKGAKGANSLAAGVNASAKGSQSVAIGSGATVTEAAPGSDAANAVAFGSGASAHPDASLAFGGNASANSSQSVAVGSGATVASGATQSVAVGSGAAAQAEASLAFGGGAVVSANASNSVALGNNSLVGNGANNATAIGFGAAATYTRAIAIGSGAQAIADNAVVIGTGAKVSGTPADTPSGAVAIGYAATASGTKALALGQEAQATRSNSLAFGTQATTTGLQGVAIGKQANSAGSSSLAVGPLASSAGSQSVALGYSAVATNQNDVALGAGSVTSTVVKTTGATIGGTSYPFAGNNPGSTVSVGSKDNERTITNVAAGRLGSSSTDAVNGSQLYATNQQVTVNSTRIDDVTVRTDRLEQDSLLWDPAANGGAGAFSARHGTTATSKIVNVARGALNAASTDAVNGSQLYETNQQVADLQDKVIDAVIYDSPDHTSVTLGGKGATTAVKLHNVAAGEISTTSTDAVNGSQLHGLASTVADALGGDASVNDDGSLKAPTYYIGGDTYNNVGDALKNVDVRVTNNTQQIDTINNVLNNINTGAGIRYFHANSSLPDSLATGDNSVAVGGSAVARGSGSMALGTHSTAAADNAVALGAGSSASRANTVSVGAAGSERQITNVAAGTADTDAVNVSQLKAAGLVNGDGSTNAAVTYDTKPDGSTDYRNVTLGSGDSSDSGGTTIHNVAAGAAGTDAVNVNQLNDALNAVSNIASGAANPMFAAEGDRQTETASANGTHSTAMGANAVAQTDGSVALGAGSVADRENTVSVGTAGGERQVANVAAGTRGTDAVNLDQLNGASAQSKQYTDRQIAGMQSALNQLSRNAYSGVAAATALTMIPDVDLGKTIAVGIGTASYRGYQASAVGATARVTQNLKIRAGAGTSSGGTTFGIGASYQW